MGIGPQPVNCSWSRKASRNISGPGVEKIDLLSLTLEPVLFYLQWPERAGLLWRANKAQGRTVSWMHLPWSLCCCFFLSGTYLKKKKTVNKKDNLSRLLPVMWYKLGVNEKNDMTAGGASPDGCSALFHHYVIFFLMAVSSFWSSMNLGRFSGL